jgi:D-aminopeptidase
MSHRTSPRGKLDPINQEQANGVTRREFLHATGAAATMSTLPAAASNAGTTERSPQPQQARARARDLGIILGDLPPGPYNSITDVSGLRVGHTTVITGKGPLVEGRGPARTGVTAILPHDGEITRHGLPAAVHVLNGNGEMTGVLRVRDTGLLAWPILLTGTWNVGRVYDFALQYLLSKDTSLGDSDSCPVPVVAETSDATLNDMWGRHITYEDVAGALDGARGGVVPEGAVGGGTGMRAFGFKAGIGSASRRLAAEQGGWTVGVLVQANFGARSQLRVDGVPVGRELRDYQPPDFDAGGNSVIVVVATDAPLLANHLTRLCKRASLGLARTGSIASHGSGDIILALSTGNRYLIGGSRPVYPVGALPDGYITNLYQPTVEATEEAVINALTMASTMVGKNDYTVHAIPLDRLQNIMRRHGRLR